jgi:hypothetical protein
VIFWPTLGIISRLKFANAGLSLCAAAATTHADKTNAAVMRLMVEQIFGRTALSARATNLREEQDWFIHKF